MSFYKKNRNNDNYREQPSGEKKKTRFQISNKSFQSATVASSFAITFFALILFIIKAEFAISESDIQSISGIVAGLCGFALAIPLFLKDFDITSNFWKQFYLIAITFLIAAFIGVVSFLIIDDTKSINVTLYLWFFISIVISVNVNNISILIHKTRFKFRLSINPIFNLSIAYFTLFISLFFSKGDFWIYATVLFTIYGFYLILTLMLSILIELFSTKSETEDNDVRIKKAIQYLVEKYKNKALTEQMLLDKLKLEEFPNEQEIISRTKVQELVTEMDFETTDNEPKIAIYEYDKIIPRWTKAYDEILNETKIIITTLRGGYWGVDRLKIIDKKDIDKIYEVLSNKTNLSKELLKENNCISKYYLFTGELIDRCSYENKVQFIINNAGHIKEGTTIHLDSFYEYDIAQLDIDDEEKCNYTDKPMKIIWKKDLSEME